MLKTGIMQVNWVKIRVENSVDPDQVAHLDLHCFPKRINLGLVRLVLHVRQCITNLCTQWKLRSDLAFAQSDPSLHFPHSDITTLSLLIAVFTQALEIMENLENHQQKVPCMEKSWNLEKKTE